MNWCSMVTSVGIYTFFASAGDCGDPSAPASGSINYTNTTVGHTIIYSCYPMYKLLGRSSRTCLITGQWSGSQPICIRECPVCRVQCKYTCIIYESYKIRQSYYNCMCTKCTYVCTTCTTIY